jgi:hypothetical protein
MLLTLRRLGRGPYPQLERAAGLIALLQLVLGFTGAAAGLGGEVGLAAAGRLLHPLLIMADWIACTFTF